MKHKVSELEGALLDAAVAKAECLAYRFGRDGSLRVDGVSAERSGSDFAPSQCWEDAGPIIEREGISLRRLSMPGGYVWLSGTEPDSASKIPPYFNYEGHTPLIAAMRAYVASKFGEEVDL